MIDRIIYILYTSMLQCKMNASQKNKTTIIINGCWPGWSDCDIEFIDYYFIDKTEGKILYINTDNKKIK